MGCTPPLNHQATLYGYAPPATPVPSYHPATDYGLLAQQTWSGHNTTPSGYAPPLAASVPSYDRAISYGPAVQQPYHATRYGYPPPSAPPPMRYHDPSYGTYPSVPHPPYPQQHATQPAIEAPQATPSYYPATHPAYIPQHPFPDSTLHLSGMIEEVRSDGDESGDEDEIDGNESDDADDEHQDDQATLPAIDVPLGFIKHDDTWWAPVGPFAISQVYQIDGTWYIQSRDGLLFPWRQPACLGFFSQFGLTDCL